MPPWHHNINSRGAPLTVVVSSDTALLSNYADETNSDAACARSHWPADKLHVIGSGTWQVEAHHSSQLSDIGCYQYPHTTGESKALQLQCNRAAA